MLRLLATAERAPAATPARGVLGRTGLREDHGASMSTASRSSARALRRRRETCIWDTPTRSAICVWVKPPTKRSSMILAVALGKLIHRARQGGPDVDQLEPDVVGAEGRRFAGRLLVVEGRVDRLGVVRRARLQGVEHGLARSARRPRRGPRPSAPGRAGRGSSRSQRSTRRMRSLSARGTCRAQAVSRKWRLISPIIVGTANDENASPRSGSNRSTALTRAMLATWRRSSNGCGVCR